ncbi:MAG: T9SS type A sorting domain-containing protein [Bacteroidia bacterium]
MKKLFTLFLMGWLANGVWAQSYSFSVNQETYQDLQNDYLITNDTIAPFAMLILGRDYRAFGHDLNDTLNIGVNGWVTCTSDYYSFALDPLIGNYHFPDTNSRITFAELADPGNSILKIQWKNVGTDGDPSERLNFQLWIYEKDQKVEFRFGPGSTNNDFFSGVYRFDREFTQTLEKVSLIGNPASPAVNAGNGLLSGIPVSGTVYRFSYLRASLETPTVKEIGVYPNPGRGSFQIDGNAVRSVKAFSLLGNEISIHENDGYFQMENPSKGIYVLYFEMEDGSQAQAKLVIKD